MTITRPSVFYHGSITPLATGLILKGRGQAYHDAWCTLPHYEVLEATRPAHRLAHRDAVFMCTNIDDIDCCGGGTESVALLQPLGPVSTHDLNWTGIIQVLLESDHLTLHDPEVLEAAHGYWEGLPTPGSEQVWECLTPAARVLACHDYDDLEAETILKIAARHVLIPQ